MYVPKQFAETDSDKMVEFIRAYPLGTLVTMTSRGIEANPIPFVFKSNSATAGILEGHLARANSQWETFRSDVEALVIFQGPDAYITPSWYATKRETGKAVPTWNYVTVHAYGQLRVTHDQEWLRRHVGELTDQHERLRVEPWHVSDAPADYTTKMLRAIVGVELQISRLVGKWKLGQNRPRKDQDGMVAGLWANGEERSKSLLGFLLEQYDDDDDDD